MKTESDKSEMRERFAYAFVCDAPGNASRAAKLAGYAERSCRVSAHNLMQNPSVQARIREIQFRELNGKLTSKALGVLEAILDDPNAPAGVRVDACRVVLDRAGLVLSEQPQKQLIPGATFDLAALAGKLAQAAELATRRKAALDVKPSAALAA